MGFSHYLSLNEAASLLPGHPHISTLHRWRLRGCKGVKFQTCKIGGRRYTTHEWIQEYIQATTAAAEGKHPDPQPFGRHEDRIRRAEQELADDGV